MTKAYSLIPLHITTQNFNFCTPHGYPIDYFKIFSELQLTGIRHQTNKQLLLTNKVTIKISEAGRRRKRNTNRQAGRQPDKQTDGQRNKYTDIDTHPSMKIKRLNSKTVQQNSLFYLRSY